MPAFALYLCRLLAALVLVGVSLVFLTLAIFAKDAMPLTLGISAATAIAGAVAWPRTPNAWRNDKPTERQLAYARDLGIRVPARASKGDVSDLISQAKALRDAL